MAMRDFTKCMHALCLGSAVSVLLFIMVNVTIQSYLFLPQIST